MFELEERYQDYEQLLLSADCLHQNAADVRDLRALARVSERIHTTLSRGREATLSMLLDTRDEVLTVGSDAFLGLRRHLATVRSQAGSLSPDRGCLQ